MSDAPADAPAPAPPGPPDVPPGPAPVRRWPKRTLIGINIFLVLCILAAAGGYFYVKYRFGQIKRVHCSDCADKDGAGGTGSPMTILLVGSDTRADISKSEAKAFCEKADCSDQTGPEHSDTILLLHIDPRQQKATVLSIPRDTFVPIAGTNHRDRINSSFANGPDGLIATIKQNFHIDINHFVIVDFVGFRGIVNAVGGIKVYFPAPARDAFSGLNVANPGCIQLDGNQALGYVRSRHYEYFEGGRWHPDPYSDFSRIQRQQDFIRRVLKKMVAQRNPFTVNSIIGTAVHDVRIDSGLSQGDIITLGKRFRNLSPDAVEMFTLPGDPVTVGGAAVLKVHEPDADQTIAKFLQTNPAAPAIPPAPAGVLPNSVHIRVLNGTGRPGEATTVAKELTSGGFAVTGTGDADSFRYITPIIKYGPGQEAKAQLLQAQLTSPAQVQADATIKGVDLVFITGSGFTGVRVAPAAGAGGGGAAGAGATTTVPPTTTTTANPNGPQATPGGIPNKGAPVQPVC